MGFRRPPVNNHALNAFGDASLFPSRTADFHLSIHQVKVDNLNPEIPRCLVSGGLL